MQEREQEGDIEKVCLGVSSRMMYVCVSLPWWVAETRCRGGRSWARRWSSTGWRDANWWGGKGRFEEEYDEGGITSVAGVVLFAAVTLDDDDTAAAFSVRTTLDDASKNPSVAAKAAPAMASSSRPLAVVRA